MPRRAELVGIVRPEVDDRSLDRETQKMEESFASAANISANIDTRQLQRKLEQAIPGGEILGTAIDAVAGVGGGGGGSAGGGGSDAVGAAGGVAGEGATLGLLEEQAELLQDIRDELRGDVEGGGGGGGAGAFALGRATAGSSVIGSMVGSLYGSLTGVTGSLLGGGAAGSLLKSLPRIGGGGGLGFPAIGPELGQRVNEARKGLGNGSLIPDDLLAPGSGGGAQMALTGPLGQESGGMINSVFGQLSEQFGEGLLQRPAWIDLLAEYDWPDPGFLDDLTSFSWPDLPSLSSLSWPTAPSWAQELLNLTTGGGDSGSSQSSSGSGGNVGVPDFISTVNARAYQAAVPGGPDPFSTTRGERRGATARDDQFRNDPAATSFSATSGERAAGNAYDSRYSSDPAAEESSQSAPQQMNIDVQFAPNLNLQGQNLRQALEDALKNETGNLEQQILSDLRNEFRSGF